MLHIFTHLQVVNPLSFGGTSDYTITVESPDRQVILEQDLNVPESQIVCDGFLRHSLRVSVCVCE
jgi:hypothetical protein